jgi:hypothetical protein
LGTEFQGLIVYHSDWNQAQFALEQTHRAVAAAFIVSDKSEATEMEKYHEEVSGVYGRSNSIRRGCSRVGR